jgi:hypothetical protein
MPPIIKAVLSSEGRDALKLCVFATDDGLVVGGVTDVDVTRLDGTNDVEVNAGDVVVVNKGHVPH